MTASTGSVSPEQIIELRDAIANSFSGDELPSLSARLRLDPADVRLRPGGKREFILELILYLQRRGALADLIRALYDERPDVDWSLHFSERPPDPTQPPFPGLRPFASDESDIYFGRRPDVARLVTRLRAGRFVAVLGASGSGKSSLLHAGLIPALRDRPTLADGTYPPEGSETWYVPALTPTADPLGQLALALTSDLPTAVEAAAVRDQLAAMPQTLPLHVRKLLGRQQKPYLLLIVDQFEELFTQCQDDMQRKAFITAIDTLVNDAAAPASLIIGLRNHFQSRCLEYEELRRLLERPQLLLGPMGKTELTQAIVGPAQRYGLHWEPGLAATLLDDLGAGGARAPEPGALPLLALALREIWSRRDGDTLTLAAYSRTGNVKEVIGRSADRVYEALSPECQSAMRALFPQLVRVMDDGDGKAVTFARQRRTPAELLPAGSAGEAMRTVIETLAREHLLTQGQDAAGRQTVELAHEALIFHWPRLNTWLEENREAIDLRQKLADDVRDWKDKGDPSYLYGGQRLRAVEASIPAAVRNPAEIDFIAASRTRQWRRRLVVGAAGLAIVALAAILVWNWWRLLPKWEAIYSDSAVTSLAVAGDALYFGTMDYGVGRLQPGEAPHLLAEGLPTEVYQGVTYIDAVTVLAVDSVRPGELYAMLRENGVYRSADGGLSWRKAGAGLYPAWETGGSGGVVELAAADGRVMAVLRDRPDDGLYASLDAGASWRSANDLTCPGDAPPSHIAAIHAGDDARFFVGAMGGLYAVDARAACWTWEQVAGDLPSVERIAAGPGGTLYLATADPEGINETDLYRLAPSGAPQWLATVGGTVMRLTADLDSERPTLYVLLINGDVLAVTPDGEPRELDSQPDTLDMILAPSGDGLSDGSLSLFRGHNRDGLFRRLRR